jgi:hypothetical protein
MSARAWKRRRNKRPKLWKVIGYSDSMPPFNPIDRWGTSLPVQTGAHTWLLLRSS